MAGDIDREGVEKAYGRWAPVYDLVFGKVFDEGRRSTIAEADRIGGRVLDVGVGTGLSLSDYSRSTKLCGVDISESMLRKAQQRVRALGLSNVETLAVMDAKHLAFADASDGALFADPLPQNVIVLRGNMGRLRPFCSYDDEIRASFLDPVAGVSRFRIGAGAAEPIDSGAANRAAGAGPACELRADGE